MLVQQYRYDMSWQQDPVGATVTSNYGGSRVWKSSLQDAWKWEFFRQVTSCINQISQMDLETFRFK